MTDTLEQNKSPPALRDSLVVFRNTGLIDVRAITTFGLSVKDPSNTNPIGYFGTGLKYAIAVLLRAGLPIIIYSGTEAFSFSVKQEIVREKTFDMVYMNDRPLGFTTDLGKNWDLWQAFRELYSNCRDEFGETVTESMMPTAQSGQTQIVVEGEAFVELFQNRSQIFLQGDPLIETQHANVHGGSSNHIFYRGIRVGSFKDSLMYRYDLQRHIELTEDRTIKYRHQMDDTIVDAVLSSDDEKFIESILTAPETAYEHGLNFLDNRTPMSEAFRRKAAELRRRRPDRTNKSAVDLFERNLRAVDKFETYKPSAEEFFALTRAIDFLAALNFHVERFQIVFVVSLGESTLAMAEDEKIILSSRLFHMGTKNLASTLFEEYVHLQYGYADCTRSMQTFLFDSFISLGERLSGNSLA